MAAEGQLVASALVRGLERWIEKDMEPQRLQEATRLGEGAVWGGGHWGRWPVSHAAALRGQPAVTR